MFRCILIFILCSFLSSCHTKAPKKELQILKLPASFNAPLIPEDNPLTQAKISLGKALFFDKNLSGKGTVSCADCHQPTFAFADTTKVSMGHNGELGFRNSPTLVNVAFKPHFHMDGGIPSLEMQSLAPIIDTNELGKDFHTLIENLTNDSTYSQMFINAFQSPPSVFGITRALACYERSLIFGNSKYDNYIAGNKTALSKDQIRGYNLFTSDSLNCMACHNGEQLTNYSFQNTGMEITLNDSGRARITQRPEDSGKFLVPTLRNVAITGPYMHNGDITTLREVIIYFENGGGSHPNKSKLIQPFQLNEQQRQDLLAFFSALTDSAFISEK